MKHPFFLVTLFIWTLIAGRQVTALSAEAPFEVSAKSTFSLTWRGKHITSDKLFQVKDKDDALPPDPLNSPEGYRSETLNGETVQNTWKMANIRKNVTYRREVASDGKYVEVTTQFRVPVYYFDNKPQSFQVFYQLAIPLQAVAGMNYKAVVRQSGRVQTVSGTITPGTAPTLGTQVLYITFEDQNGHHLSFDFGPSGVTSFDWNTSATSLPQAWWGGADTEEMRFSIGRLQASTYPYNGVYNGKVIIDESTFEQWQQRHAHHIYQYFMELPPIYQYSFGAGTLDEKWLQTNYQEMPEAQALARKHDTWIPANKQLYNAANNFGWKDVSHINLEGDVSKGVLQGAAKSTFPGEFQINVSGPGIYIFTIRIAAQDQQVGPFSVTSDGQVAAQNVTVSPEGIKTITFSRYIKNGQANIQFSGNWSVSTIAVQMLINQFEDFTFERGLWLAQDIPTPTSLFQRTRKAFSLQASVQEISPKGLSSQTHDWNVPQQIDFKADHPGTAWRWSSNITSLGPSLKGSFYEFETEEEINRRLDELQKVGYTTILLNGMHIRHAWPDQAQHTQEVVARIVKLAHQRDMKVLDHFSSTIIPNLNDGFQLMLDNIDWTLRDVRNGQVTRGFDITNPHFQKYFYDRVVNYVKATQLDGIMIDEISLQTDLYSGSEYSRAKFHHDTGLTLPINEHSPDLFNPKSRLWREWMLWRTKAQADFGVLLMEKIRQINPDFVWMRYTAPSIFLKKDGVFRWNGRMSEASRYSNFLGIESLTNNVYANFRSKFAIANIFNSFTNAEHIPAFDLTYPQHQPVFAYAGWALNNMTGHQTWSSQGDQEIEKDAKRYLDWKDNMNARYAEQVADVAVLFSRSTRDFSPQAEKFGENENLKGIVQQLGDLDVPYRVILDRDVSLENLQQFKLLLIPNSSAMNDAELDIIHQYLESGGNVIATATTGLQDEFGFPRKEWAIGKWMGLEMQGELAAKSTMQGALTNNQLLQYPDAMVHAELQNGSTAKVLLQAQQKGKAAIAVAQKQIGKGSLIWCAPEVGSVGFEPYARSGITWKYQPNDSVLNFVSNLVSSACGDKPVFQAVQIPQNVLVTIYRQKDDTNKVTTFVHLYNGTGVTLKKGEKIPTSPPKVAFPKLTKDIIFDIDVPGKSTFKADFVSPDFEGSRNVTLESLGSNRYRVTMPAKDLEAYGMVRIREK